MIICVKDLIFSSNNRLLNNLLCTNACLCKWKVKVKAVCIICTNIETSKHLIYECKKCASESKIIYLF